MPAVRELTTTWGFNVNLEPLKRMAEGIESLKGKLLALVGVEGTAAATVVGFVHFTAEAAEEARRAALTFGLTTDAYQELAYAARMTGVSQDDMGMAFSRMSSLLDEARQGGEEAAKVFYRLGIRPSQLKSTEQAIQAIADRFKSIGDAQKRIALARQVFGRSGATLLPWLMQGSEGFKELGQEAREFAVILSEESIEASHKFTISMKKIGDIAEGLRNIVGSHLTPMVTRVTEGFIEWYRANREIIQSKVLTFADALVQLLEMSWWAVRRLYLTINQLASPIGGVSGLIKGVAIAMGIAFGLGSLLAIGKVTGALFTMAETLLDIVTEQFFIAVPWILLGAAVVLAGLAIEDLMTYFTGTGDSVTAMLVAWVNQHFPRLATLIGNIRDLVVALGSFWIENLVQILNAWKAIGDWLESFFKPLIDKIAAALSVAGGWFAGVLGSGLDKVNSVLPEITQQVNATTAQMAGGPANAPASAAGSNVNQTTIAPQFNITANTAADADAIASKVRDVHRDELSRILGPTLRATQKQEAY